MTNIENDYPSTINTIYDSINYGVRKGVLHLNTDHSNETFLGVNNHQIINFSSYSYLNLEGNQNLIDGGVNALKTFGTQFGYSRAFLSLNLYKQLEELLKKIYESETLVAPSTTLAHQAVLPTLISSKDLVLVDQNAHASIHYAVRSLKNVQVDIIRHNRVDLIEEKIKKNTSIKGRIWYLADGIYSMHGDVAPLKELESLMNKYQKFHLYVDDAHGMSWIGEKGKGYALSTINLHNQMILITSLNKAFCGSGGAIILPNVNWKEKIRTCGGPLIFSTPIPPPMLGVSCASALFHLSEEFDLLQKKLHDNIAFFKEEINRLKIPEVSNSDSPVFYIPTSYPKLSYVLSKRMMECGYYITPTVFPAVSSRKAGLRICVSALHSRSEITEMLTCLLKKYREVVISKNINCNDIAKAFKINESSFSKIMAESIDKDYGLNITIKNSINDLDSQSWNNIFEHRGNYDSNGLLFLEEAFKGDWSFFYILIKDFNDKIVAATFLTISNGKDDMFKSAELSQEIELIRFSQPEYLCSKLLMMGSQLSEGEHLYLDYEYSNHKQVFELLIAEISKIKDSFNIENICLRDFEKLPDELNDILMDNGYARIEIPDFAHDLNLEHIDCFDDLMATLSTKKRQQLRKDSIAFEERFVIEAKQSATTEELNKYYHLYLAVKKKSFLINTNTLKFSLFEKMNENKNWEFLALKTKDTKEVSAVVFCFVGTSNYVPLLVGVNYDHLFTHKNYKQAIYQIAKHSILNGVKKVNFGFTATIEKKRIGAIPIKKYAYVQLNDNFNSTIIENANIVMTNL